MAKKHQWGRTRMEVERGREKERQTSEKKEIQTFRDQERMKPRERDNRDRVRDTKRQNLRD